MNFAEEAYRTALQRNQANGMINESIIYARNKNASATPKPGTRYQHNPYIWTVNNTASRVGAPESNHASPRQ